MAELRIGSLGEYYGSVSSNSEPLNISQMEKNASYIYRYLSNEGWTINAISAMLGNMQAESTINPGRWQNDEVNINNGYGLVQWTPSTKYANWCVQEGLNDPSEMDTNIKRILYEVENNLQWIKTSDYDISFSDFTKSSKSIEYLSKAFLLCYERPADQSEDVQNYRASLGEAWYVFLTGDLPTPIEPSKPKNKKKKYNFILFNSNKRRSQWIR